MTIRHPSTERITGAPEGDYLWWVVGIVVREVEAEVEGHISERAVCLPPHVAVPGEDVLLVG